MARLVRKSVEKKQVENAVGTKFLLDKNDKSELTETTSPLWLFLFRSALQSIIGWIAVQICRPVFNYLKSWFVKSDDRKKEKRE